jgi:hypothetical protein
VATGILSERTWSWLRIRVEGLLARPDTRLFYATAPPPPANAG